MRHVDIFTDGAAKANPRGPGGYAAIVKVYKKDSTEFESIEEFAGGSPVTTNNKMELMGVFAGLERVTEPSMIRIYSDSSYIIHSMSGLNCIHSTLTFLFSDCLKINKDSVYSGPLCCQRNLISIRNKHELHVIYPPESFHHSRCLHL